MSHKVYLSRRNIQSLLNKLDRVKSGDFSNVTLIKCDNLHAKYPQTMEACRVTGVEKDEDPPLPQNDTQIHLTRSDLNNLLMDLASKTKPVTVLTLGDVAVYPLEDAEYYDTRAPGEVHHADDPGIRGKKV
jgi:hypothetical protein